MPTPCWNPEDCMMKSTDDKLRFAGYYNTMNQFTLLNIFAAVASEPAGFAARSIMPTALGSGGVGIPPETVTPKQAFQQTANNLALLMYLRAQAKAAACPQGTTPVFGAGGSVTCAQSEKPPEPTDPDKPDPNKPEPVVCPSGQVLAPDGSCRIPVHNPLPGHGEGRQPKGKRNTGEGGWPDGGPGPWGPGDCIEMWDPETNTLWCL